MIISNQEVAVHLKLIRNLSHYTSGRYQLRISLYSTTPKNTQATPLTVLEKEPSLGESRSEFDEECFITRTFTLKSGAYIELNEAYLFKVDAPLDSATEPTLTLNCELIQKDSDSEKRVNSYSGVISSSLAHEYLEMDFYETAPCQVTGSIHRCHYRYQFEDQGNALNLQEFCDTHCKENKL